MWIAVVFVAALFLMAALMPKPNIENARAAKLGDLQFPRSKYGDPLPVMWGTVRQKSPITSWFGDFKAVPVKKKMKTGLFSSKRVTVGYKNYLGIDCVLCLGEGVRLRRFWAGKYLVWEGNQSENGDIVIDKPNLFGGDEERGGLAGTITFYNGGLNPPQDPYLRSVIGDTVPAYNGIARALFKSFYIGTTTTPEAFSFELQRITSGLHATYSVMPNGLDVNPMEIAYDAMVQKWGRLGDLSGEIDMPSFIECARVLYEEGMGMSLLVQSPITGKDLLEEVMRVADGVLYQDPATAKVMAKLIRQDYDVDDLLVLDASNVSSVRNFQKTTWENTFNQCRVTFKDRASDYDDSVAVTQDFANINFQNRIKSTEISMPAVTNSDTANKVAARQLSILNVPLYKCDITANRQAQGLRVGSVFKLDWSPFGITNMVMRVTKIDFGTLTSNEIKISCVQDRFASSSTTFANPVPTEWTPINTAPQVVTSMRIWTPPAFLSLANDGDSLARLNEYGALYVCALSPSPTSIAYDAVTSLDNFASTPNTSLEDAPYNGGGTLLDDYSASVAMVDRHDTSGTLIVTGISQDALDALEQDSTGGQARNGSALLMIGDELVAYAGYTNNGGGQVTFENVYRGVLDTEPEDHVAGSSVWFVSSADGLMPELLPIGERQYTKLLDKASGGKLSLDAVTSAYTDVTDRASRPLPVAYLAVDGSRSPSEITSGESINISWRNRSRLDNSIYFYNDTRNIREPNTETYVRWTTDGSSYIYTTTTGSDVDIDTTGMIGELTIEAYTRMVDDTSNRSTVTDTITVTIME